MKKIIALALSTVLMGCSTTSNVANSQADIECTFPDSPSNEAPSWVCDVMPSDLGAGAVGYADKSVAGLSVMRTIALNEARGRLAVQIESDINNKLEMSAATQTSASNENATDSSTRTSSIDNRYHTSTTLRNTRTIASIVSPAGGLYTLVGMDKETYERHLQEAIKG